MLKHAEVLIKDYETFYKLPLFLTLPLNEGLIAQKSS